MNAYLSPTAIAWVLPEIVLAGAATLILVLAAFLRLQQVALWLAGLAVAVAAWFLWQQAPLAAPTGPLAGDALGIYLRWLALAVGALFVPMFSRWGDSRQAGESLAMLLYIVGGAMLASGSDELVLIFVGLELISIPTYVLLYLGRHDAASQESAAKYFFLNILSSAVMLYGFSFLYGITGSMQLSTIAERLAEQAEQTHSWRMLGGLALVLIFSGLGFKIGAVPFHFYAPDVYQGTTNTMAALMAVIPKVAGIGAMIRITTLAMPTLEGYGWRLALILALLTMTVGNVLALWQDNLRRMLAYSSIANAGYMLIGLAVAFASRLGTGEPGVLNGIEATLFFLTIYSLSTVGLFATLAWLGSRFRQTEHIDDLAGLSSTHPLAAGMLGVFLFSLAGIPPLAGFWAKFQIFFSALGVDAQDAQAGSIRNWFLLLAVVGVINAAIAAAYYLRVIAAMYFRSPIAAPKAEGGFGSLAAGVVCTMLVVLIGLVPGPLINRADEALAPRPEAAPAVRAVEMDRKLRGEQQVDAQQRATAPSALATTGQP